MKKVLKYLFLIILIMTFKSNALAATLEIINGSCGDANHAYEFYKIFDKIGDGEEIAYQYKVTEKWKEFFLSEESEHLASLDEYGIVTEFSSSHIEQAASEALEYVSDNSVIFDLKPTVACPLEGNVEIELEEGYYLIKSPRGNVGALINVTESSQMVEKNMDPMVILYFGENVTNNLKYATIGDTVTYNAEVILREGTTNAYFEIIGNNGITINPTSVQISSSDFDPSCTSPFTLKTTNLQSENAIGGFEFPEECLSSLTETKRLMLTINGKVNGNILFSNNETTNVNDVVLKLYYGDGKDTEAKVSVISWKYTVNTFYKEDETIIDIPNVHYSLSKTNSETPELFDFVKISDGVYRVALDTDRDTTTDLVNTSGKSIVIEGLNLGTYYLIQDSRPAGFATVYDPATLTLEIADNSNGRKLKVDTMNIELATESIILPMTGGSGTTLLTTISLIVFVLSLSLIITKMRKKNN